ncbi:MAG: cysteine hydrolase [Firmicutes bacterium]|nr:cysteine hydrolase [Bacillota bacterium]
MKPAIVLTDMVNDFIRLDGALPVGEEGLKIIPRLQKLLSACRKKNIPIIYANDALLPNDFMFESQMRPHGIRGTAGVQIIDELKPEDSDLIVHKRRLSAFFKTDLDITLKEWDIDTIIVGGVAAEVCVLSTAYDGISHNFRVIVLEDCCASRFKEIHGHTIAVLKRSPMYPLLRVMTLAKFLQEI